MFVKTLSGRHEPEFLPSLVKEVTSARRARRCFHRVISGMEKKGAVRLLTLTTAKESDNAAFQEHFRMLRMRLLRRGLLTDYIRCPEYTESHLRHEHIIFRGSYIDQLFISHLWNEIHGAPVVYLQRVRGKRGIASYLAKYMAKALQGRYSYSWGWVWKGFCKSWKLLKAFSQEYAWSFHQLLTTWRWCIKVGMKPEEVIPI